ncbi:hypothetical protein EOA78_31560 [Mesorhizobium sp. M5C.F.Cr.IN.023.01.1.1]|uniref:hypothetical protein n=1 Tax=Mesorhizobium sp. M5C.F.Cr.IN.023.01.1.1 TaxID=2496768 RepID=UPI000FC9EAE6|nr:hypothetical protein [Mesorhizobium sp. M5C.F.Cr.IN.023.01.1.1]RUV67127.1 hypothetical protein EOA78_31560 [Mesorhizobium sp. M5C.F.Cr.IN.023.01.1.1]
MTEKDFGPHSGYVMAMVERAIDGDSIRARRCFTCGGQPTTGIGEHVFPKWLQTKFRLHDERLTLLNGTFIPYRSLTVPCCSDCNTGFLSRIETEVQSIIERGRIVSNAGRLAVARWMAKILVGILVKETALLLDRKDPSLGNIMTADFIGELAHCQLLLQSARKLTRFSALHGKFPFTIYSYRIDGSEDDGFDLSTDVVGQSIAMRAGKLGLAFVNDGGLQMINGDKGPFGLEGATVMPHQFGELAARVHTKASLRDATHFYLHSETQTHLTIDQLEVRPFTSTMLAGGEMQVFEPWDSNRFAVRAALFTRLDEGVFLDRVTGNEMTTLTNLL